MSQPEEAFGKFLVRSNGDVPFGKMMVSSLETLVQACVHDGLGGAVIF